MPENALTKPTRSPSSTTSTPNILPSRDRPKRSPRSSSHSCAAARRASACGGPNGLGIRAGTSCGWTSRYVTITPRSAYSAVMTPNVAKCLLVSKVLVADGMMSDSEREFLSNMMTKLGLTDDERRRVIDLEGWDEAERIVNELSEDERRAIVELLVDAASADGHLSPHELATVKRVSAALKLNP